MERVSNEKDGLLSLKERVKKKVKIPLLKDSQSSKDASFPRNSKLNYQTFSQSLDEIYGYDVNDSEVQYFYEEKSISSELKEFRKQIHHLPKRRCVGIGWDQEKSSFNCRLFSDVKEMTDAIGSPIRRFQRRVRKMEEKPIVEDFIAGDPFWIDIQNPDHSDLKLLAKAVKLHEITVEDIELKGDGVDKQELFPNYTYICYSTLPKKKKAEKKVKKRKKLFTLLPDVDGVAKFEEYEEKLFKSVVTDMSTDSLLLQQQKLREKKSDGQVFIHILLFWNMVITIHYEKIKEFDMVLKRMEGEFYSSSQHVNDRFNLHSAGVGSGTSKRKYDPERIKRKFSFIMNKRKNNDSKSDRGADTPSSIDSTSISRPISPPPIFLNAPSSFEPQSASLNSSYASSSTHHHQHHQRKALSYTSSIAMDPFHSNNNGAVNHRYGFQHHHHQPDENQMYLPSPPEKPRLHHRRRRKRGKRRRRRQKRRRRRGRRRVLGLVGGGGGRGRRRGSVIVRRRIDKMLEKKSLFERIEDLDFHFDDDDEEEEDEEDEGEEEDEEDEEYDDDTFGKLTRKVSKEEEEEDDDDLISDVDTEVLLEDDDYRSHTSSDFSFMQENMSVQWVVYALFDASIDLMMPKVDLLAAQIDEGYDKILDMKLEETIVLDVLRYIRKMNGKIDRMRRLMLGKGKIADQMLSVKVTRGKYVPTVTMSTRYYVRDVRSHVINCLNRLSESKETLSHSHSNYLMKVSLEIYYFHKKIDDFMNRLTILSVILMPFEATGPIWGMNMPVPGQFTGTFPNENRTLYWFFGLIIGMTIFSLLATVFFMPYLISIEYALKVYDIFLDIFCCRWMVKSCRACHRKKREKSEKLE